MSDLYILFESAAGYSLFQKMELEQIGTDEDTVQAAMADKKSFSKVWKKINYPKLITYSNLLKLN